MDINKKIQSALQHYQSGDMQTAEDICGKILEKQPDNINVLNFIGAVCFQRNKFDSAMRYFEKALRINPDFAEAHNNMGNILKEQGRIDEAIGCYRKAIALNTDFAIAYNGLGAALQKKGCIDKAIDCFRKSLQINPHYAEAYNNLGNALREKGYADEAIKCFLKALEINPAIADIYNNMGNAFRDKSDLDKAIAYFEKALQLNPKYADAHYNMGNAFEEKALYDNALTFYREALHYNPDRPEIYNSIGNAFMGKGLIGEALSYYEKSIQLDPGFPDAYNNLGRALQEQGKMEEAEKYYSYVLRIAPDSAACFSNLLLMMNYDSRRDPQSVFSEHLFFAKKFAEPLYPKALRYANDISERRRIKIGYVSPDLRRHSVRYFIEPVLNAHNHSEFEVFCYSDVFAPDNATLRLQCYADQWRNIAGMKDEKVDELIRADRIDILIDLAGHTGRNRMLLFARKPAPVQASWLGYPNTTGLATVDYRFVDRYTDPPGMTDRFCTEELKRMPQCFLCYLPNSESPVIGSLPAIASGHITFGSFNNFAKVTSEVTGLWIEILKRVPGARLVLKAKGLSDPNICHHVGELFAREGISGDRLSLLAWEPSTKRHLNTYNQIDIGLDTYPYNGTTTTCEALWMGVPVITLSGNTHASRVGTSILSNVGLPNLIARTPNEYIQIAVALANNRQELQRMRESLREKTAASPLTDAKRFTASLENCYLNMWQKWCNSNRS
jgi:protein O-GlcNAc transferase